MTRAATLKLMEGYDREIADALIGVNPAASDRIGQVYSAVVLIALDRDEKLRAAGLMEE